MELREKYRETDTALYQKNVSHMEVFIFSAVTPFGLGQQTKLV